MIWAWGFLLRVQAQIEMYRAAGVLDVSDEHVAELVGEVAGGFYSYRPRERLHHDPVIGDYVVIAGRSTMYVRFPKWLFGEIQDAVEEHDWRFKHLYDD